MNPGKEDLELDFKMSLFSKAKGNDDSEDENEGSREKK